MAKAPCAPVGEGTPSGAVSRTVVLEDGSAAPAAVEVPPALGEMLREFEDEAEAKGLEDTPTSVEKVLLSAKSVTQPRSKRQVGSVPFVSDDVAPGGGDSPATAKDGAGMEGATSSSFDAEASVLRDPVGTGARWFEKSLFDADRKALEEMDDGVIFAEVVHHGALFHIHAARAAQLFEKARAEAISAAREAETARGELAASKDTVEEMRAELEAAKTAREELEAAKQEVESLKASAVEAGKVRLGLDDEISRLKGALEVETKARLDLGNELTKRTSAAADFEKAVQERIDAYLATEKFKNYVREFYNRGYDKGAEAMKRRLASKGADVSKTGEASRPSAPQIPEPPKVVTVEDEAFEEEEEEGSSGHSEEGGSPTM